MCVEGFCGRLFSFFLFVVLLGLGFFGGSLEDCEWSVGQMIKYKSEL